jgi:hypothetical protein
MCKSRWFLEDKLLAGHRCGGAGVQSVLLLGWSHSKYTVPGIQMETVVRSAVAVNAVELLIGWPDVTL